MTYPLLHKLMLETRKILHLSLNAKEESGLSGRTFLRRLQFYGFEKKRFFFLYCPPVLSVHNVGSGLLRTFYLLGTLRYRRCKVTRLDAFSTFVGQFLKVRQVAEKLGYFFQQKTLSCNFDKKCFGPHFGLYFERFFAKSSGHP
jgi:hypothetical protein